jgi:hypothetical protein
VQNIHWNCGSLKGIVTGYGLESQEIGNNFLAGMIDYLFLTVLKAAL